MMTRIVALVAWATFSREKKCHTFINHVLSSTFHGTSLWAQAMPLPFIHSFDVSSRLRDNYQKKKKKKKRMRLSPVRRRRNVLERWGEGREEEENRSGFSCKLLVVYKSTGLGGVDIRRSNPDLYQPPPMV